MEEILSNIAFDFAYIQWTAPDAGTLFVFCFSAFLLLCSGFISASEIAFFSLSPSDISELEEERLPVDSLILRMREESERLLATILISNNLVNVAIVTMLNFAILRCVDFGMA